MYIVYITTNLKNDKMYIGVHEHSEPYEFDGYLGSGKRMRQAIKKYGKENFVRETLFYYWNEDEAYKKVSASKIGRKWFHNPETKQVICVLPDKVPQGFISGKKVR